MLAAAALTLWGGERLARRSVEERQPADRALLLDFSATFGTELDRLADLYREHVDELVGAAVDPATRDNLQQRCDNLMGLRSLYVFSFDRRKIQEVTTRRTATNALVPSLDMEDGYGLHTARTLLIPKSGNANGESREASDWIDAPDGVHRVYWSRSAKGVTVALVVDERELQDAVSGHLRAWAAKPFAPLSDRGELAAVYGPRHSSLFLPPVEPGPAALLIPHRTSLGEWQVQAWDKLSVRTEHDRATLLLSCGVACTLALAGIHLYLQQGRALKLAEERVSFVNRVSHELGTPLTNILLNLDLAQRWTDSRPVESRRRLKLVDEEVRRLARLVQNVLTFSRGERKTLELHPSFFVPDDLITEVLGQFEPSLERHGIRVERSGGAGGPFLADADAFSQIVGNLISNVEKYAAEGGWLGIDTAVDDGRLRIRIADAGPGIPTQAGKRIFEAFERVSDGVAEGATGTGLGLAIARDLAVRMGGSLQLLASGKGAVFELELPVSPGHLELFSSDQSSAA
jgi:signal transduction histidine kinase